MSKRTMALGGAGAVLVGGAALAMYAVRARTDPSACPFGRHFFLELPRPTLSRGRLRELLAPRPGRHVLEIGPGTGYYALDIAPRLVPGGALEIFDLQQGFLDATMRRAGERAIANVIPTRGDAQALSYADRSFDAAYLVAVLGEVPDTRAALAELRRVLKPGGRLVVGEALPDPHMIAPEDLRKRAEAAGFRSERRVGGRFGYGASFLVP